MITSCSISKARFILFYSVTFSWSKFPTMSNSPFLSFIWRRSSFDFLVQPQNALLLPFSDDEIERGTPKNFIYDNIWLHMFIYLAFGIFCLGNRKLNTAALNLIEWFHGSIEIYALDANLKLNCEFLILFDIPNTCLQKKTLFHIIASIKTSIRFEIPNS